MGDSVPVRACFKNIDSAELALRKIKESVRVSRAIIRSQTDPRDIFGDNPVVVPVLSSPSANPAVVESPHSLEGDLLRTPRKIVTVEIYCSEKNHNEVSGILSNFAN